MCSKPLCGSELWWWCIKSVYKLALKLFLDVCRLKGVGDTLVAGVLVFFFWQIRGGGSVHEVTGLAHHQKPQTVFVRDEVFFAAGGLNKTGKHKWVRENTAKFTWAACVEIHKGRRCVMDVTRQGELRILLCSPHLAACRVTGPEGRVCWQHWQKSLIISGPQIDANSGKQTFSSCGLCLFLFLYKFTRVRVSVLGGDQIANTPSHSHTQCVWGRQLLLIQRGFVLNRHTRLITIVKFPILLPWEIWTPPEKTEASYRWLWLRLLDFFRSDTDPWAFGV